MSKKNLRNAYMGNLAKGNPGKTDEQAKRTQFAEPGLSDAASVRQMKKNAGANSKKRRDRLLDEVKSGKPITKPGRLSSIYSNPKD